MQNKVLNFEAERVGIEVNIGKEQFFFATDDESLIAFESKKEVVQKKTKEITEYAETLAEDDVKGQMECAKQQVEISFDLYFGAGEFERFYTLMPSIIRAMQVFGQVEDALIEEMNEISAKRQSISKEAQAKILSKKAKKAK